MWLCGWFVRAASSTQLFHPVNLYHCSTSSCVYSHPPLPPSIRYHPLPPPLSLFAIRCHPPPLTSLFLPLLRPSCQPPSLLHFSMYSHPKVPPSTPYHPPLPPHSPFGSLSLSYPPFLSLKLQYSSTTIYSLSSHFPLTCSPSQHTFITTSIIITTSITTITTILTITTRVSLSFTISSNFPTLC